ncbi:MAG: hypothetical protein ACI9OJ_004369 [Myxococcota bacterium]|jgi:hypothetical protein
MRPAKIVKEKLLERVRDAVASGSYRILPHARQRCTERDVSAPDIERALEWGHHGPKRDRYDEPYEEWSYCFEGRSLDEERLRVVVAFDDGCCVVTVVRLDDSWEG